MTPTDQAIVIWTTGNCVAKLADLLCLASAKSSSYLPDIASELAEARKSIALLQVALEKARK